MLPFNFSPGRCLAVNTGNRQHTRHWCVYIIYTPIDSLDPLWWWGHKSWEIIYTPCKPSRPFWIFLLGQWTEQYTRPIMERGQRGFSTKRRGKHPACFSNQILQVEAPFKCTSAALIPRSLVCSLGLGRWTRKCEI